MEFSATTFLAIDAAVVFYAVTAFLSVILLLAGLILFVKAKFVTSELCKIRINDNPDLTKSVAGGGTLLSALTSEGIAIPSPCGGKATCLQCRVRITEGADAPIETDCSTFTKKELCEGWRLSCQSKLKHDISIQVDESCLDIKEIEAKVVSNENVATFIKELVVEIPEAIRYRPGDYLQFHVPPFKTNTGEWKSTMNPQYFEDWEKYKMFDREIDFSQLKKGEIIRAYSMASYPEEQKIIKFNIRIATPPFESGQPSLTIPWGICSSYTFSLKAGDTVFLLGPYGESHMIDDQRDVVFLIGGAGSSFGRSHILDLFYTKKTKRNVSLWYGARSLRENIYEEDYKKLEQLFDNFSYHLVLSEPHPDDIKAGWPKNDPLKTAFLFKAFEEGALKKMDSPEEALFYVCGPPPHNKSVMKLLDDYGVPRENIILDDFGS